MKSQQKFEKSFSFELFPPKTDKGMETMKQNIKILAEAKPMYFSVTYGAGGSTQRRTFESVDWLVEQGFETAPHLSCIGSSREEIIEILNRYKSQGIRRLVALRGDLPSGAGLGGIGELGYANELVTLVREQFGNHFEIKVAAYPEFHPQSRNAAQDLENFKRKMNAGANCAITQYFYNPDAYFAFIESCEKMGLDKPVTPGIMPITNYSQLARFSDGCGTEIPRWIRARLEGYGDDLESIRAFGTEVVTRLCERLLEQGAPGLHFYTMNRTEPTLTIWRNLGL